MRSALPWKSDAAAYGWWGRKAAMDARQRAMLLYPVIDMEAEDLDRDIAVALAASS